MAHYVNLGSSDDVIIDVAIAEQYILCVTEDGRVYSWGKNTGSTIQVSIYMHLLRILSLYK